MIKKVISIQERTKRKLSGILSADVVGYSRMMEEDEAYTIQCLEENKKLIGEIIEEYKGRVVDAPGDNILAEFSSVVNAVECAVNIQNILQAKNSHLLENSRMYLRIGVNLGDVVDEDGRIYGDGVNIAARIEGLAEPGGICISSTAYDQVKTKLDLGYEYLGEHNLKNISEPVRVYRVLTDSETAGKVIGENRFLGKISRRTAMTLIIVLFLAAAGSIGWIIYSHQTLKIEEPSLDRRAFSFPNRSLIAVLPFANLSEDHSLDYFSASLTEDIIACLSKHPDLSVFTRNFPVEPETTRQEDENSSRRYILEGKIRPDEKGVKINVRLSDAEQGYIIWTEVYDREINGNPLSLQWRIFREIRIRLIDRNQKPDFLPENSSDIEYTEKFHLLYRYYRDRSPARVERLNAALELADRLIETRPDPWVYYMKGSILIALSAFKDGNSDNYLARTEEVAAEAGKLDEGAKLGILGQIYISKFERSGAENNLELALDKYKKWVEVSPDSKNPYFGAGYTLFLQKRYDESINYYEAGLKIDPRPESQHFVFLALAYSRPSETGFSNLEKAIENLRKAVAPPNENNFYAHLLLTLIFSYDNNMEMARFHAREMLRTMPRFSLKVYRSSNEEITKFHLHLLEKVKIFKR